MISGKTEVITPARAVEILKNHVNFRGKYDASRVEKYARRMRCGKWHVGPPLMFNANKEMTDGEHRIRAVIEVNEPQEFFVMHGVPSAAVVALDGGKPRSRAVQLRAGAGVKDRASGRAALLSAIIGGECPSEYSMLASEAPDAYRHFQKAVQFVVDCFPTSQRGITRASILAAWGRAYIATGRGDELKRAAQKIASLDFGPKDTALKLLVKYASRISGGGSDIQVESYLKAAGALKDWLNGEQPTKLLMPPRDPFPLPHNYKKKLEDMGF